MWSSRRKFLAHSCGLAASGAFAVGAPEWLLANALGRPIGLQLYTVAAQLEKDYDGTLRQVAAIGYREVELASTHGKKPAEVRESFEDAGLHCGSVHVGMGGIDEALRYATELGAKYVISSVLLPKPPVKFSMEAFLAALDALTLEDYKRIAEKANHMGEAAKKAGMQFGYHNHNFEFRPFSGGIGYDEVIQGTDPSLVKFELDCGWMAAAGHHPVAYLTNYPGRYRLLHIKDFQRTAKPSTGLDESARPVPAELGRGHIDYKPIFAAAKKSEVEWYYVEQEPPFVEMPALQAIKVNYDYLRKLD